MENMRIESDTSTSMMCDPRIMFIFAIVIKNLSAARLNWVLLTS